MTKRSDYQERARKAWETRRRNLSVSGAAVAESYPEVIRRGRGRPRRVVNEQVEVETAPQFSPSYFSGFEVTPSTYTFEQVQELGVLAVTSDGRNFRLVRSNGKIVPASSFGY